MFDLTHKGTIKQPFTATFYFSNTHIKTVWDQTVSDTMHKKRKGTNDKHLLTGHMKQEEP